MTASASRTAWVLLILSAVLVVALLAGDAIAAGRAINPVGPRRLCVQGPPVLDHLARAREDRRLFVWGRSAGAFSRQMAHGPAGWDGSARFALGTLEMLVPPVGARFRVFGSYDGDFTGLAPPSLSVLTRLVWEHLADPLGLRLLQWATWATC